MERHEFPDIPRVEAIALLEHAVVDINAAIRFLEKEDDRSATRVLTRTCVPILAVTAGFAAASGLLDEVVVEDGVCPGCGQRHEEDTADESVTVDADALAKDAESFLRTFEVRSSGEVSEKDPDHDPE